MKKILWLFILFLVLWFTFAQVQFEPIYTSERFQPSDVFHAGCENQIDILFNITWEEINWVNAILNYNPNDIEIIKVVWENERWNNLSYVVNDNKIYLNKLRSDDGWWSKMVKFSIYFKSNEWVSDTRMFFEEGSYLVNEVGKMVNFDDAIILQFVSVPECDPDIISPKVNLLYPKEDMWTPLDTYFQFDISDSWKGINEDSIVLSINGIDHNVADMEYEWDTSVLTIYPDFWMPLNTGFEVKISVSDKQVYGWENTVTKVYQLETPSELYLMNNITPSDFRKIVNSQKYYKGTTQECKFLANQYVLSLNNLDTNGQKMILDINKKLNCPEIWDQDVNLFSTEEAAEYSVFSILWWLMFGLSFLVVLLLVVNKKDVNKIN